MRTLYGKKIRKGITDSFYPDKIDIETFRYHLVDSFEAYTKNMKNLNIDHPKYIEEWAEQYLSWLDIEQEN